MFALAAAPALAHPDHGAASLASGLAHPLGGLDHLLAMLAVGLFAVGEAIGMGATSGQAFCGGMSVTPALSFGRILGRSLADA